MATGAQQGWYEDPFGLHEARYFSAGRPTKLVRDGKVESYDEPPSEAVASADATSWQLLPADVRGPSPTWPAGPGIVVRSLRVAGVAMAVALGVVAVNAAAQAHQQGLKPGVHKIREPGIHKIRHVIVIMQENRSFDSYFGTFPGADGIPAGVCLPDPLKGGCRKPWVDHYDSNENFPHGEAAFRGDYNGGKMDGFVAQADTMLCPPKPVPCHPDVMGYHTGSDIPNYWAYAQNFVLQDHMFEAPGGWSLPAHLYEVSAWSANCSSTDVAASCRASNLPKERLPNRRTPFAWTDITWLLHKYGVSWGYYLDTAP